MEWNVYLDDWQCREDYMKLLAGFESISRRQSSNYTMEEAQEKICIFSI